MKRIFKNIVLLFELFVISICAPIIVTKDRLPSLMHVGAGTNTERILQKFGSFDFLLNSEGRSSGGYSQKIFITAFSHVIHCDCI